MISGSAWLKRCVDRDLAKTPLVIRYDTEIPSFGDPTIMKIQGDLENMGGIVITSDDYIQKQASEPIFYTLYGTFATNSILMVGCGLEDTDFKFVYLKVLSRLRGHEPRAFLVSPTPDQNSADFGRWELKRMKWDERGTEHINDKAGSFLTLLSLRLEEDAIKEN